MAPTAFPFCLGCSHCAAHAAPLPGGCSRTHGSPTTRSGGKGSSRIKWSRGCCGEPRHGRAAPGAAGTIGDALEQTERFSLDAECVLKCLGAVPWFRTANCSRAVLLVFLTHISAPIKPFHGLAKTFCGHITDTPLQRETGSAPQHPAQGLLRLRSLRRGHTAAGSWHRLQTARPPEASTLCIPLCVLLKLRHQPDQARSKASKAERVCSAQGMTVLSL